MRRPATGSTPVQSRRLALRLVSTERSGFIARLFQG
jgi:hypothetical protein